MSKNNEFEPIQSDAALRSLKDDMNSLKSALVSMQDGYSKMGEFLTSDSFKKVLNVIDIGADEAEMSTNANESGARSSRRLIGIDTAQGASNAFLNSVNEKITQTDERSGLRLDKQQTMNNFFARRESDDQFWTNLIRFKAVSGEVDPDSLVTVMKELNKDS